MKKKLVTKFTNLPAVRPAGNQRTQSCVLRANFVFFVTLKKTRRGGVEEKSIACLWWLPLLDACQDTDLYNQSCLRH